MPRVTLLVRNDNHAVRSTQDPKRQGSILSQSHRSISIRGPGVIVQCIVRKSGYRFFAINDAQSKTWSMMPDST
jgi:hypothetical protein